MAATRSPLFKPPFPCLQRGNILSRELLAAWTFTEGSGLKAYDHSGYGSDGTLTAGPTWVGGQLGSAISFASASSQYIDVGTMGTVGQRIASDSYSFWIKTTQTAIASVFGTFNTGITTAIQCNINADQTNANVSGKIEVFIRDDAGHNVQAATTSATTVNDGNWHHVAVTCNGPAAGSAFRIFFDGALLPLTYQAGSAAIGTTSNFGFSMTLGARNVRGTIGQFLNGTLDGLMFWDRVISFQDVALLFVDQYAMFRSQRLPFLGAAAPVTTTGWGPLLAFRRNRLVLAA